MKITIFDILKRKLFPDRIYQNTYMGFCLNVNYGSHFLIENLYIDEWVSFIVKRIFDKNSIYGMCGLNVSHAELKGIHNYSFIIRNSYKVPILVDCLFNKKSVLEFFNWLIIKPMPQLITMDSSLHFNILFKTKDNSIDIEKENYIFNSKTQKIKLLK